MGMNENIESLDKEIARITTKLSKLEPESDAYKAVRVSLDTLYKLRNNIYKVDTEDIAARDKSEVDVKQKDKELEVRKQELDSANIKIENERQQKEAELKATNARFDREMAIRESELNVRQQELDSANTKIENERLQKEAELEATNARFDREMAIREQELEVRKQELEATERQHQADIKSQRASRVRDYVVTGITTVVKIGTTLLAGYLTFAVAKKGYAFEENGCPTSKTFRDELKNATDLFKDLAKSK